MSIFLWLFPQHESKYLNGCALMHFKFDKGEMQECVS